MAEWLATLIPVLGRALLHFVWQGAVIGLAAAIVLQVLRNARPQARYAVACAALLACALVPLVGVSTQIGSGSGAAIPDTITTVTHLATTAPQRAFDFTAWPARFDTALPWIVAMWAAGAGVLSLRMTLGVVWVHRLRNTPQGPSHVAWQARLDELAVRFGLQSVALRLVDALESPASAGWWRPVILLPTALISRMPVDLIEALLAHELAHIRRHDYLFNLLQCAVEALLFYHPVTWWLSRRIRVERELIADQVAAQMTGEPRRLALALSELSDFNSTLDSSRCPSIHLAQAAHGGHLMSRIEQLVRPGRPTGGGRMIFPLLGLAAALVAFYAQAQIAESNPTGTASKPPVTIAQTTSLHVGKTPRDAYALIRKGSDGVTMSGSTDDLRAIKSAQRSLDGDFVWFRRNDKTYVVTDPAIVARAEAAWHESNKLGAQMETLGDQMQVHGAKMEALGAQMEKLSAGYEKNAAMETASKRMEVLAKQQQVLAAQQSQLAEKMVKASDVQQEQLERQMDALSEQQDALSGQMDQQAKVMDAESERLEARMQPMEALGRQMDEAGKPMEALGEQMDALGEQQEKLVAQAERDMERLIGEALNKGLAVPAPGATKQQ